jgi:peptide/nickel transport system substrate-binding protein
MSHSSRSELRRVPDGSLPVMICSAIRSAIAADRLVRIACHRRPCSPARGFGCLHGSGHERRLRSSLEAGSRPLQQRLQSVVLSDQQTSEPGRVYHVGPDVGAAMRRYGLGLLPSAALVAVAIACSSSNNNTAKPASPAGGNSAATQQATKAAAASPAVAAASQPSAGAPVRGGSAVTELDSDTKNLDPLLSSLAVDRQVYYQMYDSLVQVGPDLKIAPDLADSWDTSNPTAVVFKLHPGIKFHDGTDFNADAVKFNIDRILKTPTSPRLSEINTVTSVDVVDPLTVKFNLKAPFAPLLANLVDRAGMILSPAAIQKNGDNNTLAPVGAGTGPFTFVEWKQGDHITLQKTPNYWKMGADGKPLPYLDKLTFRIITDENQRLNNLKTGDVDFCYNPPAKDIASIKKDSSVVYKDTPAVSYFGFELNLAAEPFNNKSLRQAVAYALDRDQILTTVFFGLGAVSNGPISPPLPPYDKSYTAFTHDIAKAKAMLAAGSKPQGFSFDMLITADSPQNQQEGELIKDELKDAGITVNLVPEQFPKQVDDAQKHNFQATLQGWSGRIDPDGNTYNQFHTGGGNNDMQYSSTQADQLLDQGRATFDPEKRIGIYKQLNKIVADDVAWVFINHGVAIELHSPRIKNYTLIADNIQRWATVWKTA